MQFRKLICAAVTALGVVSAAYAEEPKVKLQEIIHQNAGKSVGEIIDILDVQNIAVTNRGLVSYLLEEGKSIQSIVAESKEAGLDIGCIKLCAEQLPKRYVQKSVVEIQKELQQSSWSLAEQEILKFYLHEGKPFEKVVQEFREAEAAGCITSIVNLNAEDLPKTYADRTAEEVWGRLDRTGLYLSQNELLKFYASNGKPFIAIMREFTDCGLFVVPMAMHELVNRPAPLIARSFQEMHADCTPYDFICYFSKEGGSLERVVNEFPAAGVPVSFPDIFSMYARSTALRRILVAAQTLKLSWSSEEILAGYEKLSISRSRVGKELLEAEIPITAAQWVSFIADCQLKDIIASLESMHIPFTKNSIRDGYKMYGLDDKEIEEIFRAAGITPPLKPVTEEELRMLASFTKNDESMRKKYFANEHAKAWNDKDYDRIVIYGSVIGRETGVEDARMMFALSKCPGKKPDRAVLEKIRAAYSYNHSYEVVFGEFLEEEGFLPEARKFFADAQQCKETRDLAQKWVEWIDLYLAHTAAIAEKPAPERIIGHYCTPRTMSALGNLVEVRLESTLTPEEERMLQELGK